MLGTYYTRYNPNPSIYTCERKVLFKTLCASMNTIYSDDGPINFLRTFCGMDIPPTSGILPPTSCWFPWKRIVFPTLCRVLSFYFLVFSGTLKLCSGTLKLCSIPSSGRIIRHFIRFFGWFPPIVPIWCWPPCPWTTRPPAFSWLPTYLYDMLMLSLVCFLSESCIILNRCPAGLFSVK